jgi:hypothetical protein
MEIKVILLIGLSILMLGCSELRNTMQENDTLNTSWIFDISKINYEYYLSMKEVYGENNQTYYCFEINKKLCHIVECEKPDYICYECKNYRG